MKWRHEYRTILQAHELPFTAAGGNGLITFDRWEQRYRNAFTLTVAFAFNASEPVDCMLYLVDPDERVELPTPLFPTVVILDTVASGIGPVASFYEDNVGQGFAVPYREKTDLPYEVQFVTAGESPASGIFEVFLWWEAKFPSVELWELLCATPELCAGMSRERRNEMQLQLAGAMMAAGASTQQVRETIDFVQTMMAEGKPQP